jgi:putative Mn2+ efflux pump MntP
MIHKKASLVPGLILIAIGLYFLMNKILNTTPVWYQIYPVIILVFAGFLFWEAIRTRHHGPLFWGVFLLFTGAYFLLVNYNILPDLEMAGFLPVVLISAGLAFCVRFIVNPREWGVLVPGTLLLYFGLKTAASEFYELDIDVEGLIDNFWPLILIIIGTGMIISGLFKTKKRNETKVQG